MLNTLQIIGIVGGDADVRAANNMFAMNFSLACNETWKDASGQKQERTYWTECVYWFKSQESAARLAEYITKGSRLYVHGVPYATAYVNKEGQAIGKLCLRVRQLDIIHSTKEKTQSSAYNHPAAAPAESYDDDLPF